MNSQLDLLRAVDLPHSVLAICDDPADIEYLEFARQCAARLWARVAGLPVTPTAWPEEGRVEAVLLPLSGNKASLALCLAAGGAQLQDDGCLYLFGSNDAGIKSTSKVLEAYFAQVELVAIGGHGRLFRASAPQRRDTRLQDLQLTMPLDLPQGQAHLIGYPGLFAKGKLDAATALLFSHLPPLAEGARVLDFACGAGIIAYAARQAQPGIQLLAVDNDALAIAAAAQNLPGAETLCLANPTDITGSYDVILSNPPIHKGATLDYGIVEQLIGCLPRLLADQGIAYLVAQVTVPLARMAAQSKLAATEVAANKSFRVVRITKA